MENELLCHAWFAISADFVGRSRWEIFLQQVHELFHRWNKTEPYNMYRWYAIHTSVTKFCNLVCQVEARWPLRGWGRNRKFCFMLLYFLIDRFTQWLVTHYVAHTHCCDVPHGRVTPNYVYTVGWSWRGGMCVRSWSVDETLLNIWLI